MWRRFSILLVLLFMSGTSCKQADNLDQAAGLEPPAPGARSITAEKPLPSSYLVGSQIKDEQASGFSPCNNFPRNLGRKDWGRAGEISLVAFPDEPVAYSGNRGLAVRVINRTAAVTEISASDSHLYIVQEALDADGQWREIETLRESKCGNSFHRVFLKSNQYWEFSARTYDGPIITKMRFRLDPSGMGRKGDPIYSNEYEGQVAKVQFR